ncbi:MAG TPA: radical SAM protein [Phycisphaerae bacterium]|nr:radical SAM protein [Phycisphaerae bacterium]
MISISRLYCGVAGPNDALRYGAGRSPRPPANRKPVVVWNCTRRCNLRCIHCYSRSDDRPCGGEMATAQSLAMLEDLARFGVPVILFSGGEALMRGDLIELVRRAVALGMRAVISTNGTLITPEVAGRLREAGVSYVGVSLDGMRSTNDSFRGREGAFDEALAGIRNCRQEGIKVGLRFTVTQRNAAEVPEIFSLARDEDIPRVCFYHLVCVGRGRELRSEELDHDATRRLVDRIVDRTAALHAEGPPKEVLTVDNHADGPYLYLRMVREGSGRASEALRLLRIARGNASGIGIGAVSWDGSVHPDQFWRSVSLGNVTERKFSEIWSDLSNPLLVRLRDRRAHLRGRCAACRFLDVCNGNLRVRAEAATGDAWACDPACYLTDDEIAGGPPGEGE